MNQAVASSSFSEQHAFVCTPKHVKRIWEVLGELGHVTAEINCADSMNREFPTLAHLLAFTNPEARSINWIELRAKPLSQSECSYVRIGADPENLLEAKLRGREDTLTAIKNRLDEEFFGMRASYFLMTEYFEMIATLLVAFVTAVPLARYLVGADGAKRALTPAEVFVFLMGIVAVVVLAILVRRVSVYVYPKVTFTTGDGEDRFKFKENIRWTVFVGFPVGVVASIVAGLML